MDDARRRARQTKAVGRRRRSILPWLAVWALGACFATGGCGNYSNEDLEFMNAIPLRADVAVEVPRQSSLTTTAAAEGWQRTFKVTRDLNMVADAFLSLIDKIRASYPTARDGNTRIWGPFAAEKNPGWQIEFRMSKSVTPMPQFDYELVVIPPPVGGPISGGSALQVIGGRFDATGGARVGTGHLVLTLDEATAAGFVFEGLEMLSGMTIDYQTGAWPRNISMAFANVAPASQATDAVSGTYTYTGQENGDGAMSFSWVQDIVPGPAGNDTVLIESRWLATGQGREDLSIVTGDGMGNTGVECWDPSFQSTYKSQTWAATVGDESTCIRR